MSNDKKTKRSYLQTIRLPILLSSALVIAAVCALVYFWSQSSQNYQQQHFSALYNQGLSDTSAAFLGHYIEDEDIENIESIGQRLASQENIQKISIYRRNGELMFQQAKGGQTRDVQPHSEPVIADISYENTYNGYLILYFAPTEILASKNQPSWLSSKMIWGLGALVWFLVLLVLYGNRWFKRKPKKHSQTEISAPTSEQNTQLLKDLIRRNKQHKDLDIEKSVVIKSQWTKLSSETNNKLLRVLSRWLPQNGLVAKQFNHDLLVLGLLKDHSPVNRNPLYALNYCLDRMQLESKIMVHRLDFGQEIYEMFFDIIEPGIWFEKHLIETGSHYNWPTQKTIDIELDDQTVIELCQLEEPDAEQRGLLERQVRFLMDD